jgi:CO dehydrogenase/acetyl-CoA synthase beta subunit
VKLVQSKLSTIIATIPTEAQPAVSKFLEEAKTIASAKDFDYLLAKLKGQGTEVLQKILEEEEKQLKQEEEEETAGQSEKQMSVTPVTKDIKEVSDFIMPVQREDSSGPSPAKNQSPPS